MSTVLRSLRPQRNELKKTVEAKPAVRTAMDTEAERAAYIIDLKLYHANLAAKRASFYELHRQMLTIQGKEASDQKTLDDYAESDSALLVNADAVIAEISTVIGVLTELEQTIVRQQAQANEDQAPRPPNTVRLPMLELTKFDGAITKWREFWDCFEASVHRNAALSPIDKMNYLRAQVVGEAAHAISGLATTAENYEMAVKRLKERFGDVQLVIDAHYAALADLVPSTNQRERLRGVVDGIEQHLNSLEALGENVNHRQFISMIKSKLPPPVVIRLEEQRANDAWDVKTLREHLLRYVAIREAADQAAGTAATTPSTNNSRQKEAVHQRPAQTTTRMLLANTHIAKKCVYCGESNHWSDECRTYATINARKQKVKGYCFNCLKRGHNFRECSVTSACAYCKRRHNHHRSLCPKTFPTGAAAPVESAACAVSNEPNSNLSNDTVSNLSSEDVMLTSEAYGLLQTATTTVQPVMDGTGARAVKARLLLDCGSQRSYVTTSLISKLGVRPKGKETLSIFTFGATQPRLVDTAVVSLRLMLLNGGHFEFHANVVPEINGGVQQAPTDLARFGSLYATLPLADQHSVESREGTVDVLIGTDYYWDLVTAERIQLDKGLYLIGSKLGWIFSGRIKNAATWKTKPSLVMLTSVQQTPRGTSPFFPADPSLTKLPNVSDLWDLEAIGIRDPPDVSDDDKAIENFNRTIQYEDQRYYVTWPWKEQVDELPTNYSLSLGRLNSLLRRFSDQPDLLLKYDDVIQTQMQKGIIEKVDSANDDATTRKHYIPHHPVITPDKSTTKLRVVYDGSAKTKRTNVSINECLYRGPVILENVCHLLMRFRFYKVALIADIEKAFLQVGLQTHDRDVTRFLWLKDPKRLTTDANLQMYRFQRVPFGIISSPFLLAATITYHLRALGGPIAERILRDIYVDNLITGVDSVTDALTFYGETKLMFQRASMNIREWISNSAELIQQLPDGDRMVKETTTVLGLSWDTRRDLLCTSGVTLDQTDHPTRRTVLRDIASVFDPLGLFCPILLPAKEFLQRLWVTGNDWDSRLTEELVLQWKVLQEQLLKIQSIDLPRYIGLMERCPSQDSYELHCFCDASQRAYGAAVYLRLRTTDETTVHLLFAKARLAPKRTITLPRLELLAMTVGYRSLLFVEQGLAVPISARYLWTDSQCVLYWLRSSRPLSVFVANRVREIQQARNVQYRYVNTKDNPADLASRGMTASGLQTAPLWWHGPDWLTSPSHTWLSPSPLLSFDSGVLDMINSETKAKILYETTLVAGEASEESKLEQNEKESSAMPMGIDETRYSSLTKLLRVTAWCLRFCKNARQRNKVERLCGPLMAVELHLVKTLWLKAVQKRHFTDVVLAIRQGQPHRFQRELGLWLDEEGVLRCGGRLANAEDLPVETQFPALLPKGSWFTAMVIRNCHEKLFHSGVAHTLSLLRQEFWVPSGRSETYKCIKSCLVCRRVEGGSYQPPRMPSLPRPRVTESPPFTFVGIDYLGPLYVKGNADQAKVWVCLFTCMATRAIHLELVEDLTAAQFLLCLKRFISRRGRPAMILSDNAKTFKLAKATLDRVWREAVSESNVQDYCSENGITWNFITERAPWMGGFYERMVQCVKRALRKSVQYLCLTVVHLQTILTEVEAVVNSRPLLYVGCDLRDGTTLTPSHFLSPHRDNVLPPVDCDDLSKDPDYVDRLSSRDALLRTWKKGERHLRTFWKTWRNDYLLSLRERSQTDLKRKRGALRIDPTVGDVVHVQSDLPRGSWQLARIVDLLTGKDGEIRSATVKLPSGKTLRRAIIHLYPIEISGAEATTGVPGTTVHGVNKEKDSVQPRRADERPQREAAKVALAKLAKIQQMEESSGED